MVSTLSSMILDEIERIGITDQNIYNSKNSSFFLV